MWTRKYFSEGLRGDIAESREKGQEAAATIGDGIESTIYGFIGKNSAKTRGIGIGENLSPTIDHQVMCKLLYAQLSALTTKQVNRKASEGQSISAQRVAWGLPCVASRINCTQGITGGGSKQ